MSFLFPSYSLSRQFLPLAGLFAALSLSQLPGRADISDADEEPDWHIPPALPVPHPNGYDFYLAATKAIVRFKPEIDELVDTRGIPKNSPQALQDYSLPRRLEWLKANDQTFALVEKGLKTPSVAPPYTDGPESQWSRLQQLARYLTVRSHTFQMEHKLMRATISALDVMQMGEDVTRGRASIVRLVGIAFMSIGRSPLDDWNKTINALSASEARRAAQRLEEIITRDQTLIQTQKFSKRENLVNLKHIFEIDDWRHYLSDNIMDNTMLSGDLFHPYKYQAQRWEMQTISKHRIYDNMNCTLTYLLADANLPYSQTKHVSLPSDLDPISKSLLGIPISGRFNQNEYRNMTSNNMLLLRLALRAYIVDHRAAPTTLAALVPKYLKRVPTDVYNDGKPLFYHPQGTRYRLWSVGPDGVNNGGIPFPHLFYRDNQKPVLNDLDNKGDFVAGSCR